MPYVFHEPPERIVVFRALRGLGDLLCATPALRALRSAFPDAHVTLLGLPSARDFVRRFAHLTDELLEFPGYPGIPEVPLDVTRLPGFLAGVQGRYDLAVQMHGSGTSSNPFTQLLGARVTAGTYLPGLPLSCPDPDTFVPWAATQPEPLRWLEVTRNLGVPSSGEHLEFPVTEHDEAQLRELPEYAALQREPYVVLHPGAHEERRRWDATHFAHVADGLADAGLQLVLTGTPGEAQATSAVREYTRADVIDLTGRTPLGALAALLRGARLLVTNDTGVSHLAAATRTPSVIAFVASDPARWAPTDRRRHRAVGAALDAGRERACATRCLRDGCTCLPDLNVTPPTPRDVLREAHDLLKSEVPHV